MPRCRSRSGVGSVGGTYLIVRFLLAQILIRSSTSAVAKVRSIDSGDG